MTEPVMYFGIGFLVATLLGLLIVLRVHHRTLRLGSIDQFHADVRQLEKQLSIALGERSELQREIAAMKRDAQLTWAAERIESALFRERINDLAYEVVRITQALESPDSSIELTSASAALMTGHVGQTRTLGINDASGEDSAPTIEQGRSLSAFVPCGQQLRARRRIDAKPAVAHGPAVRLISIRCQVGPGCQRV